MPEVLYVGFNHVDAGYVDPRTLPEHWDPLNLPGATGHCRQFLRHPQDAVRNAAEYDGEAEAVLCEYHLVRYVTVKKQTRVAITVDGKPVGP